MGGEKERKRRTEVVGVEEKRAGESCDGRMTVEIERLEKSERKMREEIHEEKRRKRERKAEDWRNIIKERIWEGNK